MDPSGYRRTPEKPRRGESGSPRAEGTPKRRREASGVCGRTPKQSGFVYTPAGVGSVQGDYEQLPSSRRCVRAS